MIGMIVAYDENRAIGFENKLLWSSSEDLQHFKETTSGSVVVMGRKTFESIGRPLPNRVNVVLTRDTEFKADGCVVHSPDVIDRNFLNNISEGKDVWVIGGADIYQQCLDHVDKVVVSVVYTKVENADTYFPEFSGRLAMHETINVEPYKQFPPTVKCPYTIAVFEYTT